MIFFKFDLCTPEPQLCQPHNATVQGNNLRCCLWRVNQGTTTLPSSVGIVDARCHRCVLDLYDMLLSH